jgi:hypothetical protein
MAKPTRQSGGSEVAPNRWTEFFREFTIENRGAHGRLEVINVDEIGREVSVENRPFEGISADTKDAESAIWITFGTAPEDHFTHGIHGVKSVHWVPPQGERGAALEVTDREGTRSILTLSHPQEFALPEA